MASVNDLPAELLYQIVDYLQLVSQSIIGGNAVWTSVPRFLASQPLYPVPDVFSVPITLNDEDGPDDDDGCDEAVDRLSTTVAVTDDEEKLRTTPLKALRLTNRRFNQISSSFLFRSVHLFFPVSSLRLDSLSQYIFRPHWQYIHTLRTYTDGYISSEYENKKRQRSLVSFLRECKNLKSLGLYYYFGGTDLSYISNEVVRLLDQEVLEEVGIYSMTVLESNQPLGFLQSNPIGGIMDFVTALASHPGASRALKKFDIATESMYWEIYELIRKDFPNLTSLTVRHSFRRHLWDDNYSARIAWSPKYRLTRLQLVNCQTAYAPEIPFFLQIFESLEELTISTCGWVGDERPLQIREQGWSKEPGALCKMRRPLKWLKLEHMIDWEVKALGVIPTTELSLIHWNAAELIEPFKDDEELFPGLKVLRMHQRWIGDEEEKQDKQMKKSYGEVLLEICEKRGIELRRDAERMMICFCCSFEPADF